MNRTHKRLKEILKREQNTPEDIKNLYQKLYDNIHGNTNINTNATKELINKIVAETILDESKVSNIEVRESKYNCNEDKELDTPFLYITLNIEGKCNGELYFETSSGYLTKTGEPIYYLYTHQKVFTSKLEKKIIDCYEDTYPRLIEELFLDIAINKNKYLNLDTKYNDYELWDYKPSDYSDTMQGKYFDSDKPINSFYKYEALGKINQYKTVENFCKNDDCGNWNTETVEWRRYYI